MVYKVLTEIHSWIQNIPQTMLHDSANNISFHMEDFVEEHFGEMGVSQ